VTHVIAAEPLEGLVNAGSSDGFALYRLPKPWPTAYTTATWTGAGVDEARRLVETGDAIVFEDVASGPGEFETRPLELGPAGAFESYDVTGRSGALVIARAWDSGWTATVDGVPTPVVRANGWQRAVLLPPGAQRVAFAYAPPGLAAGAALFGLGGLAITALVAWARRQGTAWKDATSS
jgi:hypothetical protein